MNRAAHPEVRLTATVFERVYGSAPATTRHIRGSLPLLDDLHVPLPWGTVVSAGHSGETSLYSMNHHAEGVVAPSEAGGWARECLTALDAYPDAGTRLVVNRELPVETGLLTGAETIRATALALQDLHGSGPGSGNPGPQPPRLICNLSRTGLRLVVIDVGARPVVDSNGDPAAAERAAAAIVKGRPADLGPLLTDAHTPGDSAHDDALEAALEAGALGGRTIGGCMVALAPAEAVQPVRNQVTARLSGALPRPPRYLTV